MRFIAFLKSISGRLIAGAGGKVGLVFDGNGLPADEDGCRAIDNVPCICHVAVRYQHRAAVGRRRTPAGIRKRRCRYSIRRTASNFLIVGVYVCGHLFGLLSGVGFGMFRFWNVMLMRFVYKGFREGA